MKQVKTRHHGKELVPDLVVKDSRQPGSAPEFSRNAGRNLELANGFNEGAFSSKVGPSSA